MRPRVYKIVADTCIYCGERFFHFAARTDPAHRRKCCSSADCQREYRLRAGRDDEAQNLNRRQTALLKPGDPAILADGRLVGRIEHVSRSSGLVVVAEKNSFSGWRTIYQARFLLAPRRVEDRHQEQEACGAS